MLVSLLAAGVLLAQATDQTASPANVSPSPSTAASSPAPGSPILLGRFVPFAERKPVPYETVNGFVYFKLIVAGAEAWALLAVIKASPAEIIMVSNEVGMGIVPENALARRFRDAAGRLNRQAAECADRVTVMFAGVPLVLKG